MCHHLKELVYLFYSSNLLLKPLQLCLHVFQLMSAVQHLLTFFLSGKTETGGTFGYCLNLVL